MTRMSRTRQTPGWSRSYFPLLVLSLVLAFASRTEAQETAPAADRSTTASAYTTTNDLRDVRPFQAWMVDATWSEGIDVEPVAEFTNLDNASGYFIGAQGAFWVLEGFEVGGRLGLSGVDPDGMNSRSGISDLDVYGRYRLDLGAAGTDIAIGVLASLPIGDAEVGASNFDFLAFGALRYEANEGITILGHAGIDSREVGNDRSMGIALGGGAILPMTEELAAIVELDLTTAVDFAVVSAGVDYELPPGGHLRAAIALGIDDVAPDAELRLGFSIPVY